MVPSFPFFPISLSHVFIVTVLLYETGQQVLKSHIMFRFSVRIIKNISFKRKTKAAMHAISNVAESCDIFENVPECYGAQLM